MIAVGRGISEDELTRQVTELAKQEVARDFSTWLQSSTAQNLLAECRTRTSKCYITERALASFVARTAHALGDYVARGALIEYAAGLSDYVERDMFEMECVTALREREVSR